MTWKHLDACAPHVCAGQVWRHAWDAGLPEPGGPGHILDPGAPLPPPALPLTHMCAGCVGGRPRFCGALGCSCTDSAAACGAACCCLHRSCWTAPQQPQAVWVLRDQARLADADAGFEAQPCQPDVPMDPQAGLHWCAPRAHACAPRSCTLPQCAVRSGGCRCAGRQPCVLASRLTLLAGGARRTAPRLRKGWPWTLPAAAGCACATTAYIPRGIALPSRAVRVGMSSQQRVGYLLGTVQPAST